MALKPNTDLGLILCSKQNHMCDILSSAELCGSIGEFIHFSGGSRRKEYNILQHRNQLFHSPGSVCEVKCTANRFRASSVSGAIWPVSSMINEKSGLILGLIDYVSHPLWIQTFFLTAAPLMLPAEVTEQTFFRRQRQGGNLQFVISFCHCHGYKE